MAMPYTNTFPIFPIIFLLLWGVQAEPSSYLGESMVDLHKSWMVEHNKVYPNEIEKEKRFKIFQENVKYINEFNAAGDKPYKLGVNQFTDLTNEERVARYTGYTPPREWNANSKLQYEKVSVKDLPEKWDWREKGAVTPVKNQYCGNCWLYAGVAEVESLHYIKTKELVELSEQEIMDCDDLPGKGGCNGGWIQEVYAYVMHYNLTTEKDYPTTGDSKTCDKSKRRRNRVAHVRDFVNMPSYLSDEELMAAVLRQPVARHIYGNCSYNLNHAMSIVGFGKSKRKLKYWIVRNSWSEGWGDGGYIKIQRGSGLKEGRCGINLTPSYPVA
ncbi:hypothetical protein QQ045_020057 [Rhodiola kirilowii]